jgi:hypothetical protein
MTATFGITGLAAMAKSVKKIITDLKDFFRISWAIVKSEASTYWKQINAGITAEITSIRDTGWQAALDLRNNWMSTSAAIMNDAKTQWASYWTSIEPSITSLKQSIIYAFQEAASGTTSAIDGMVMSSSTSLQAFESAWSGIWTELVADMIDAQNKITAGVAVIAAELKKISVSVSISGGGSGGYGGSGGSGGGSGGSGGVTDGVFGGWLDPTGDWSDMGGNTTNNINTNGGGYSSPGTRCNSYCSTSTTGTSATSTYIRCILTNL